MGSLGWQEMTMIFILALLLFGPKELPKLGRTLGKAMTEFRRASSDLKATFDRELSSLEREGQSINEAVNTGSDPSGYGYQHNYGYDSYSDAGSTPASIGSTATETSTVSASATQGAEPARIAAPEGTVPASVEANPPQTAAAELSPAPAEAPGASPSNS
jgi:sec-independent protein translocase protein TatA